MSRPITINNPNESTFVDVEAWTEETLQTIRTLRVTSSSETVRRGIALPIRLDANKAPTNTHPLIDGKADVLIEEVELRSREPKPRDSVKRRESVLKGREGTRRRQKWENDRLLGNPHVQPPLPIDWEVRPTYRVQTVPYALAALWDARRAEEDRKASKTHKDNTTENTRVPRELKEKLKRSRGAKALLQDLEKEVRRFVESWETPDTTGTERMVVRTDSVDDLDDDDFVMVSKSPQHSRNTSLNDSVVHIMQKEKLVFSSILDEDPSSRFIRFLVHSLGRYYDLDTWSVTVGDPARREAYVGFKDLSLNYREVSEALPRPLWAMV